MNYPHPLIAREGWPFIGIALVVALVVSMFFGAGLLSLLAWAIVAFVVQFFRDPPRPIPQGDSLILAPADGRIVKVEKARDPYADRDALLISVFMNVFNVHSNRIAIDGRVTHTEYTPGSFVNADLDKASTENERNAVLLMSKDGQVVTLVQVAGLIARRILCYVGAGDKVKRGQRYGFIRFGSRVDVYLPADAVPKVAPGDVVMATTTILAEFARPTGDGVTPVYTP
jgi:phosphatidylserine decarboxylase